jgi:hypothetical protein
MDRWIDGSIRSVVQEEKTVKSEKKRRREEERLRGIEKKAKAKSNLKISGKID